jgi:uncharacterized protein (DUF58 family)
MFKVSIKYVVLIIASYIFALVQGGNLPYRIFHGLLLTFGVSLIYILSKQKGIHIQIKFDKKIYSAGDNHEFVTIIKNYGILPAPYVILKNKTLAKVDQKYNGDAVWLNSDESKWIRSSVRFNQRGIYNFGEVHLIISDLFCIFEKSRNINLSIPVKVYPKVYELNKFLAKGSDIFKNTVSSSTNIEDLYSSRDIRKYFQGDNLKRVNWKVSAKHGELYVRDLDTVSGEESNLFVDMNKDNFVMEDSGTTEEQLIDLCSSVVNYMQLRGIKTKLFVNASIQRKFNIDNREDFNELMEYFITQKSDGESDFTKFVNSNLVKLPKLSWIGIVTTGVSRDLKDNLITMKDRGYNITIFYCATSLKDLSNMEILKKVGIDCYSFNELINGARSKVEK